MMLAAAGMAVIRSYLRSPVFVGLGSLDEVATVEATVPEARRIPRAEVVRLGIARMDPQDYEHLDLVRAPVPVRWAAKTAVGAH